MFEKHIKVCLSAYWLCFNWNFSNWLLCVGGDSFTRFTIVMNHNKVRQH